MGPRRPPPKPGAGMGNRTASSPPKPGAGMGNRTASSPPSSLPLHSSSQPSRTTGKIVRIPRTNPATITTSRTTTTRKRPTPSPPRDPDLNDPTTSRPLVRQRENPNPTAKPPPPTATPTVDRPRVWKRRPTQPLSKIEEPDRPKKEETKTTDPAPAQMEEPKNPPETREEERDPSSLEEGEVGEVESFDKGMMEFEELMTRSTTWVGEALGSILGDLRKLAERSDEKGRLGDLVKLSVSQLLEPAGRHVEVIGESGKKLEEMVEGFRAAGAKLDVAS